VSDLKKFHKAAALAPGLTDRSRPRPPRHQGWGPGGTHHSSAPEGRDAGTPPACISFWELKRTDLLVNPQLHLALLCVDKS